MRLLLKCLLLLPCLFILKKARPLKECLSTEGVFVPTPSIHHTSNVQPGPSIHSPPSASLPSESNVAHASVPSDVSVAPVRRTDARSDENEVDPPNPDIRFEEIPADADNNPTVSPGYPEIPLHNSQQSKNLNIIGVI